MPRSDREIDRNNTAPFDGNTEGCQKSAKVLAFERRCTVQAMQGAFTPKRQSRPGEPNLCRFDRQASLVHAPGDFSRFKQVQRLQSEPLSSDGARPVGARGGRGIWGREVHAQSPPTDQEGGICSPAGQMDLSAYCPFSYPAGGDESPDEGVGL